jgi:hypothetical protein
VSDAEAGISNDLDGAGAASADIDDVGEQGDGGGGRDQAAADGGARVDSDPSVSEDGALESSGRADAGRRGSEEHAAGGGTAAQDDGSAAGNGERASDLEDPLRASGASERQSARQADVGRSPAISALRYDIRTTDQSEPVRLAATSRR